MRTLPILLIISPLLAHDGYSDWTNQLRESCCEDRHCHPLDDSEVRTDSQNTYVKIADEWCEVKSSDYARGTSPDWSHAHICLQPASDLLCLSQPRICLQRPLDSPCERIICFMPKPDF